MNCPDFTICFAVAVNTESGVMCCDIHQKYPFLLVIGITEYISHLAFRITQLPAFELGMYDGNVAVYNLQKNTKQPIYVSKGHGKHSDVVWEVKWGPDLQDGEINFYSISADGRVFNWVLMQNKLAITTIITLFMDKEYVGGPEGTNIKLKGTSIQQDVCAHTPAPLS